VERAASAISRAEPFVFYGEKPGVSALCSTSCSEAGSRRLLWGRSALGFHGRGWCMRRRHCSAACSVLPAARFNAFTCRPVVAPGFIGTHVAVGFAAQWLFYRWRGGRAWLGGWRQSLPANLGDDLPARPG